MEYQRGMDFLAWNKDARPPEKSPDPIIFEAEVSVNITMTTMKLLQLKKKLQTFR